MIDNNNKPNNNVNNSEGTAVDQPTTTDPTNNTAVNKVNPFLDPSLIVKPRASTDVGAFSDNTSLSPVNAAEYAKYFPAGVPELPEIHKTKAENQAWYSQAFNWAVQSTGEIVGGSISGAGSILEGLQYAVSSHDRQRADFDNFLMSWGEGITNWTKQVAPIHRTNPNRAFDPLDFGWWTENGVSIASTLSLLIPARGIVSGLGWLAKTAKVADKVGDTTKFLAEAGTMAVVMRHAENMRESMQVSAKARKDVYERLSNMSDDEYQEYLQTDLGKEFIADGGGNKAQLAQYIGAKAGWHTYTINSSNIVFDFIQTVTALKALSGATRTGTAGAAAVAKAQAAAIGKPLSAASRALLVAAPKIKAFSAQLTEGVEEIVNFIGSKEGEALADEAQGKDVGDYTSRMSKYFQDGHLWNSGFWGVLGGVAFNGVVKQLEKKGIRSVMQSKIAEIGNRANLIDQTLKASKQLDADIKAGKVNEADEAIQRKQLFTTLGYQLGLNASINGNMDLLEQQLLNPHYQQELDSQLTEAQKEQIGGKNYSIEQVANNLVKNARKAEKIYNVYNNSALRSSELTEEAKSKLLALQIDTALTGERINARIEEIDNTLEFDHLDQSTVAGLRYTALLEARKLLSEEMKDSKYNSDNQTALAQRLAELDNELKLNEVEIKAAAKLDADTQVGSFVNALIAKNITTTTEALSLMVEKEVLKGYAALNQSNLNQLNLDKGKEIEKALADKKKKKEEKEFKEFKDSLAKKTVAELTAIKKSLKKEDSQFTKKQTTLDRAIAKQQKVEDKAKAAATNTEKKEAARKTTDVDNITNEPVEGSTPKEDNTTKGEKPKTDVTSDNAPTEEKDVDVTQAQLIKELGPRKANQVLMAIDNVGEALGTGTPAYVAELKTYIKLLKSQFGEVAANYVRTVIKSYTNPTVAEESKPEDEKEVNEPIPETEPEVPETAAEVTNKTTPKPATPVKKPETEPTQQKVEPTQIKGSANLYVSSIDLQTSKIGDDKYRVTKEGKKALGVLSKLKEGTKVKVIIDTENEYHKNTEEGAAIGIVVDGVTVGYLNTISAIEKAIREATDNASKLRFTENLKTTKALRKAIFTDGTVKELTVTKVTSGTLISSNEAKPIKNVLVGPYELYYTNPNPTGTGLSDSLLSITGKPEFIRGTNNKPSDYHNHDSQYTLGAFYALMPGLTDDTGFNTTDGVQKKIPVKLQVATLDKRSANQLYDYIIEVVKLMQDPNIDFAQNERLNQLRDKIGSITAFNKFNDNKDGSVTKPYFKIHKDYIEFLAYGGEKLVRIFYKNNKSGLTTVAVYPFNPDNGNYQSWEGFKQMIGKGEAYYNFDRQNAQEAMSAILSALSTKQHQISLDDIQSGKISAKELIESGKLLVDVGVVVDSKDKPVSNFIHKENREASSNLVISVGQVTDANNETKKRTTKQQDSSPVVEKDFTGYTYVVIKEGGKNQRTATVDDIELFSRLIDKLIKDGKSAEDIAMTLNRRGLSPSSTKQDTIAAIQAVIDGKYPDFLTLYQKTRPNTTNSRLAALKAKRNKTSIEGNTEYDAYTLEVVGEPSTTVVVTPEQRKANWSRYFGENVPFDANVDGIIQYKGKLAYGLFSEAAGQVSKFAPAFAESHEAIHAAMHIYLSEKAFNAVIADAKQMYGDKSQRELEEQIANDFMIYEATKKTHHKGIIKKFFERLSKFINTLLGRYSVDQLFNDLSSGYYNYRPDAKSLEYAKKIGMTMEASPTDIYGQKDFADYLNYMTGIVNTWIGLNPDITIAQQSQDPNLNVRVVVKDHLVRHLDNLINAVEEISDEAQVETYLQAAEITSSLIDQVSDKDSDVWKAVIENVENNLNLRIDQDIEFEGSEQLNKNWDDRLAYAKSTKESFDFDLKRIIMGTFAVKDVKVKDGNPQYTFKNDNKALLPQYINFDYVYNHISNYMTNARTINEMMSRLLALGNADPSFVLLHEKINSSEHLKSKWFSNFNKTFIPATHLRVVNTDTGLQVTKAVSNKRFGVADNWIASVNALITEANKNPGTVFTNDTKLNIAKNVMSFRQALADKTDINKAVEAVKNIGTLIGVELNTSTLQKIANTEIIQNGRSPFITLKEEVFDNLIFVANDITKNIDTENPIVFDSKGRLNAIAKTVSFFEFDSNENSYFGVDGNMRFSITRPSYITDWFDDINQMLNEFTVDKEGAKRRVLEKFRTYAKDPSMRLSNWMWTDSTSPGVFKRKVNDVSTLTVNDLNMDFLQSLAFFKDDGLKNINKRRGAGYADQSTQDWDLSNLLKYLSNTSRLYTTYPMVVQSDSGNIWDITAPRISIFSTNGLLVNATGSINRNTPLYKALRRTIDQELVRMKQARELLFDVNENFELVEKDNIPYEALQVRYHYQSQDSDGKPILLKNGKPTGRVFQFHNMTFVDEKGNTQSLNSRLLDNGIYLAELHNAETNATINNFIDEFIIAQKREGAYYNKYKDVLEQSTTNKGTLLGKYRDVNDTKAFDSFIMEFMLNTYLVNVEQGNYFNGYISEHKNNKDTNKRAKQQTSPRQPGNTTFRGPTYKGATITDIEITSSFYDQMVENVRNQLVAQNNYSNETIRLDYLRKSELPNGATDLEKDIHFITSSYLRINRADAQSYTTIDRYEKILKDYGRWNSSYEKSFRKIRAGEDLNASELKGFLQALKPFYYDRVFDPRINKMRSRQIKNSVLPLLPQLVKGTEMERVLAKAKEVGVEEIYFESATKVGMGYRNTITDKSGVLRSEFDLVTETYYNANWGLQLDVPSHLKDEQNKFGVQIAKIIIGNLSNDAIYEFEGEKLTGEQLRDQYFNLLSTKIENSGKALLKRIGAEEVNGKLQFKNLDKVQEILKDELVARGLSNNYLEALEFTTDPVTGEKVFTLPLYVSNMSSKFESILTSLFTNNVTNQKFPGGHVTLASDALITSYNNQSNSLSTFTNHSGGAKGADINWERIGKKFGMVSNNHYYFSDSPTSFGNVAIPVELQYEADDKLKLANKTLKRTYPTSKDYVNKLLRRNWWQVKNSDAIFAISTITDNKVNGGTGWAVHMAIAEQKPVYVFDQDKNKWYTWSDTTLFYEKGQFVETETPTLTKDFAGIGTREINQNGINAIEEVYRKTKNSKGVNINIGINLLDSVRDRIKDGKFRLNPPTIVDGRVVETEALLPAWSKKFFSEDGKRIDINEIPEELLTMIGYRIPTEAKYSMPVIKIVGFLPEGHDSTIVLPYELVTQTGWDFDVDSLYLMQRSFVGNAKDGLSLATESEAGLNNQIFDVFMSILTNPYHYVEVVNPGKFTDPVELKQRQEFLSGMATDDINPNTRNGQDFFRNTNIAGRALKGLAANSNGILPVLQNIKAEFSTPFFVKYEETVSEVFTQFDLIEAIPEYKVLDFIRHTKFNTSSVRRETGLAIGTNKDINPTWVSNKSNNTIASVAEDINSAFPEISEEAARDIIIDIFSTTPALFEQQLRDSLTTTVNSTTSNLIEHKRIAWNPDGTFTNVNGDVTTDHAAQMLAMILDIVKEGLPYNINTYTFDTFMAMISTGVTIQYAGMFINQPIIRKLAEFKLNSDGILNNSTTRPVEAVRKQYFKGLYRLLVQRGDISTDDAVDRGIATKVGDRIIFNKKPIYLTYKSSNDKYSATKVLGFKPEYTNSWTYKELEHMLAASNVGNTNAIKAEGFKGWKDMNLDEKIDYYRNQLMLLEKFVTYKKNGDGFNQITKVLNTDKLGAGPSLSKTQSWREEYEIAKGVNPFSGNLEDATIEVAGRPAVEVVYEEGEYSPFSSYRTYANDNSFNLLSSLFIEYTKGVQEIRSQIYNLLGKSNTAKDSVIYSFVKKYLNSKLSYFANYKKETVLGIGSSPNLNLDITKESNLDAYKDLSTANKLWLVKNQLAELYVDNRAHFLHFLNPKLDEYSLDSNDFHHINFKKPNSSDNIDNLVTTSYDQMFDSTNPFIVELAKDLLAYNFFTTGITFGKNSWANYIPTRIMASENYLNMQVELGIIKTLADTNPLMFTVNNPIVDTFMRNNWNNEIIVPKVRSRYARDAQGARIEIYDDNNTATGTYVTVDDTPDWSNLSEDRVFVVEKSELDAEDSNVRNAYYLNVSINRDGEYKSVLLKRYTPLDENLASDNYVYYYPVSKLGTANSGPEFSETSLIEENNVPLTELEYIRQIESKVVEDNDLTTNDIIKQHKAKNNGTISNC